MPTKPNPETDKATPRPWKASIAGKTMREYKQSHAIVQQPKYGNLLAGLFFDCEGGEETARANAALIVCAVNLFEAHEAVAKAAKEFASNRTFVNGNETINFRRLIPLNKALAHLEELKGKL